MPRNGSGAYSVPNSFSAGQSISSAAMNANFSDVGTELANSLPRDGQAAMTGQMKAANGSAAAPSITFGSDTNSGLFRKAADTIGVSVGGVEVGTISSAGLGGTMQPIPSGTVMLFVQSAAPTGWVKSTTHDNKALRVVSGNASSGGTAAFTSVFTSRTIAEANLPAHTHGSGTLAGTTDTTGAHTHSFTAQRQTGGKAEGGDGTISGVSASSGNTGSSGSHSHTVDVNSGATASTGSGTPLDFAVAYVDVILATKS